MPDQRVLSKYCATNVCVFMCANENNNIIRTTVAPASQLASPPANARCGETKKYANLISFTLNK